MATYDQLLLASVSNGTQGHVKASDSFPLFRVKCINSAYPDATLAITSGILYFTTDGTTADTTVNTTGNIPCATPAAGLDTLGEVADVINASANWTCQILGGIRSMGSGASGTSLFATLTEANAAGSNDLIVYGLATTVLSSVYYYCFAVSGLDNTTSDVDPDAGMQSIIHYLTATIDNSSAGSLKIYSSSQSADKLLYSVALADNTATPLGSLNGPPLWKSRLGERLVVMLYSDASLTGAAGALTVQGHTVDWSNGNFISGYGLTNASA